MSKTLLTLTTAAVLMTATIGATSQAQANDVGLGIAAGILGGVVIGSAIANQNHHYDNGYRAHRYHYVEEDVTVCKRVLYEDRHGNQYWKKICH